MLHRGEDQCHILQELCCRPFYLLLKDCCGLQTWSACNIGTGRYSLYSSIFGMVKRALNSFWNVGGHDQIFFKQELWNCRSKESGTHLRAQEKFGGQIIFCVIWGNFPRFQSIKQLFQHFSVWFHRTSYIASYGIKPVPLKGGSVPTSPHFQPADTYGV